MPSLDGHLEPTTVLAGKLRIIRLIGEGGMGAVYEVEHQFTKHRRALKLLRPELTLTPDVVNRFLREASAAGRIGNPHILETFDAGTLETGEPYIVMELLEGRSLADVIAQRGRLGFREALQIVGQACEAIQAAHDAGIIHRDLKPDNLFLLAGDRTFVKVLDFGISKFDPSRTADNHITHDSVTLGTPYYMSPEQVRGAAHVDGRTDVYALGVVLYECLTGGKPFIAETIAHIAVLIHEGKYEPLCRARSDAPPELELVVARALHVNRDSRYPTPAAFAEALSALAVRAATPAAHTANTGHTLVLPSGMHTGLVSDARRERRRLPRPLWLAPAVLVAVLAAVVFGNGASPGESAARVGVQPTVPAPASTGTDVDWPTPAPRVSPVVRTPELPPKGSASAVTGAQSSAGNEPAFKPRPAGSEKSGAPSRARQHGLAEENPFAVAPGARAPEPRR